MNINDYKHIYFLGIGGIGMSALARYFKHFGKTVSGYDKTKTDLTLELENLDISIHYKDDPAFIPSDIDLIIYTPAIPKDAMELKYLQESKLPIIKRSKALGMISKNHKSIAISGTHGKTTTSAILAHVLYQSEQSCNAFVGGIMVNYNANLLINENSPLLVLEADEYDQSFLQLHPDIIVVNSLDADHLDIYNTHDALKGSFQQFANQLQEGGKLICQSTIASHFTNCNYTFSIHSSGANVFLEDYYYDQGKVKGRINCIGEHIHYEWNLPGEHNLENLMAAVLVCRLLNVPIHVIEQGIKSFKGIKRRFEYVFQNDHIALIDDYAHHPSEIKAAIKTARSLYADKKITVAFQPHLFSRTRDFMGEFAESLALADQLFLIDIYPAREQPIEGVSAEALLHLVPNENKFKVLKNNLAEEIAKYEQEVVLILGAGDINLEIPNIKKILSQK